MNVRRFLAVDDCGTVINPMIVEGQIHGGLTEGFAIAFMQEISYDESGNNLNTNFTEYFVPTSLETPHWETDRHHHAQPASSDRRKGRRREPERRLAGRVRQCGHGRAVAARHHAHRDADDARKGLARDSQARRPSA